MVYRIALPEYDTHTLTHAVCNNVSPIYYLAPHACENADSDITTTHRDLDVKSRG